MMDQDCSEPVGVWKQKLNELHVAFVVAIVKGTFHMTLFCVALALVYYLGIVCECCECLWGIMFLCLMAMMMLGQHHLWILVLASFLVTFWVGCKTGGPFLFVETRSAIG